MGESRIKNTGRNIVYAFIFQIIKMALVFIGRIIFVQKLGASYLGVNGLFTNILGILSLADLGITTALMFSLYKPLAEKNEDKISQYINYFRKVYNIIAIAIGVIGIALIPFLKYFVNLPEEMPHIYLYYVLLLLNSVLSYLFIYKTTLLSADQKMYIINKYDTIFQFILFFLQTAVLILTSSFALYLIANIICTIFSNLLKVKKTQEIYPYLKEKKALKLPKEERKHLFTNLYSLFFYKLGGIVQTNTDNILISIFAGTITVGYYSNYSTIILSITTFLTLIFTSLKASVGNFVVSKRKNEQFQMFNILEIYNFILVGFCAVCFMVLIPDFIKICFGEEYVLGYAVLVWAVLNFYTSNIRQTLWMYRETTGIFREVRNVAMITASINIILSIVLGYFWGIAGVVAATVIARMIYAWWKEPLVIYKKYFNTSPMPYFITYIKRLILLIGIYLLTQGICEIIPNINIYVNFLMKMCICCITTVLLFIVIYRKSDAAMYIKKYLIERKAKI